MRVREREKEGGGGDRRERGKQDTVGLAAVRPTSLVELSEQLDHGLPGLAHSDPFDCGGGKEMGLNESRPKPQSTQRTHFCSFVE